MFGTKSNHAFFFQRCIIIVKTQAFPWMYVLELLKLLKYFQNYFGSQNPFGPPIMVALEVNYKDGGIGGGVCILFLPKRPQKRYILKKKLKVAGCLARRMGWWRWGEWKIGAPIQEGVAKHNRFNFNNWKEIEMKKWHQYKT